MWFSFYETLSLVLAWVFNGSTLLRDIFCGFCDSPDFVLLILFPPNFEIIVSFYMWEFVQAF